MLPELTDENFDEFAANSYKNPNCVSILEFIDDLKKIKYIKRLINKYTEKEDLKDRLILNHIISLSNVFGVEATVAILKFKVEEKDHHILNCFLNVLNYDDSSHYDKQLFDRIKKTIDG